MNIAYLLPDHPLSRSIAEKLCMKGKPGAIIFLTTEEHEFFRKNIVRLTVPKANKMPLSVKEDKQ